MKDFSNVAPDECPVSALSDTFRLSNEQLEAVFRKVRAESPVFYLDDIDYWAVTRFDDIKTVLGDKERYSAEITLQPLATEVNGPMKLSIICASSPMIAGPRRVLF